MGDLGSVGVLRFAQDDTFNRSGYVYPGSALVIGFLSVPSPSPSLARAPSCLLALPTFYLGHRRPHIRQRRVDVGHPSRQAQAIWYQKLPLSRSQFVECEL
jgi:hypothetical protein